MTRGGILTVKLISGCATTVDRSSVLTVLAHLQIVGQVDGVADDIVRPRGEVHVSNRTLGHHQTREHLGQVVRCDTVTVPRVDDCALLSLSVPESHPRDDRENLRMEQ